MAGTGSIGSSPVGDGAQVGEEVRPEAAAVEAGARGQRRGRVWSHVRACGHWGLVGRLAGGASGGGFVRWILAKDNASLSLVNTTKKTAAFGRPRSRN